MLFVGKDEDKKRKFILKCDAIVSFILDDWGIQPASQAHIESYTSSALHPISKLLTNWDLAQVPPQHTCTNAIADTVRNS